MSGIVGDFAAFDALAAQLQAAKGATRRAAQTAAPKLQATARAQYAQGCGPDGTPWKPNKDGTFPSLARPASEIEFSASGKRIVAQADDVLRYHQEGNPKLPRRPVFPDEAEGLPEPWRQVFEDAIRAEMPPGFEEVQK